LRNKKVDDMGSFIFISFFLYLGLFANRARWIYKDGKFSFKKKIVIEIVSFVIQELLLLYLVFNGGGVIDSTTLQEDNSIIGKIKQFIRMYYD